MLHVQRARGVSRVAFSCSDWAIQGLLSYGSTVSTHSSAMHVVGGERMGICLVLFIVSVQKWCTPFLPTIYQLDLCPWHPLQGFQEVHGAHGYSVSIKHLPQCDNDDGCHLCCHLNHCAAPSPTLWLLAWNSSMRFAPCISFHCHSFSSLKRREQRLRGVNLFTHSHTVSQGDSQDPTPKLTA